MEYKLIIDNNFIILKIIKSPDLRKYLLLCMLFMFWVRFVLYGLFTTCCIPKQHIKLKDNGNPYHKKTLIWKRFFLNRAF